MRDEGQNIWQMAERRSKPRDLAPGVAGGWGPERGALLIAYWFLVRG
jgi:hypothetical protein